MDQKGKAHKDKMETQSGCPKMRTEVDLDPEQSDLSQVVERYRTRIRLFIYLVLLLFGFGFVKLLISLFANYLLADHLEIFFISSVLN